MFFILMDLNSTKYTVNFCLYTHVIVALQTVTEQCSRPCPNIHVITVFILLVSGLDKGKTSVLMIHLNKSSRKNKSFEKLLYFVLLHFSVYSQTL